ncbi:MAG: Rrf2 family transcriptional regulator [bacterium]|nr:Rrf2 family transcriptional regulator [bacterium]
MTTRGRYAMMAMFDLALRGEREPVPIKAVAERQGLSDRYLGQLFTPLRKAGLVRSVRGAQGGYVLTRKPDEISVGDVLRAVEGPISPVHCVSDPGACARVDGCVTRGIWRKLRDRIVEVLDAITLADLCEEAGQEQIGGKAPGGVDHHA